MRTNLFSWSSVFCPHGEQTYPRDKRSSKVQTSMLLQRLAGTCCKLSYETFQRNKGADQTVRMCRLIDLHLKFIRMQQKQIFSCRGPFIYFLMLINDKHRVCLFLKLKIYDIIWIIMFKVRICSTLIYLEYFQFLLNYKLQSRVHVILFETIDFHIFITFPLIYDHLILY